MSILLSDIARARVAAILSVAATHTEDCGCTTCLAAIGDLDALEQVVGAVVDLVEADEAAQVASAPLNGVRAPDLAPLDELGRRLEDAIDRVDETWHLLAANWLGPIEEGSTTEGEGNGSTSEHTGQVAGAAAGSVEAGKRGQDG